jgi:hypothetical protein
MARMRLPYVLWAATALLVVAAGTLVSAQATRDTRGLVTVRISVDAPSACYPVAIHVLSQTATDPAGPYIKSGTVNSSAERFTCTLNGPNNYKVSLNCDGQGWQWAIPQVMSVTRAAGIFDWACKCIHL